ncbi:hypothetical protein [Pedobacter sp. JCM 36344]|uniref:hypothetical protein n=1 Tax=Pedobacter sp. JCM 36344 TaxID=3374280 RepID=UPI00397AF708
MIKSIIQISFIGLLLLFVSCKKMKPSRTPPTTVTEEEKPVVVVPPKKKKMLPIRLTTTSLTVDLIYMENSALITAVKLSSGTNFLITYAGKVLKKIQKYKDNLYVQSVDYLITDGQIVRASRFDMTEQRSTPTEKYYLLHNAKLQINNIKTYGVNGSLLSDNTLEYKEDGNLTNSHFNTRNSISIYSYSYDTKNGIFQSVPFCQLLRLEINEAFLNQGINNVLTLSNQKLVKENVMYDYQYGSDDYPTEIRITNNGLSQTYKVTYIELK